MRRLVAFILLLLLAACDRPGGGGAAFDRLAPGEEGRVAEIVSGHYLKLANGPEVRLVGLISPKYEEPHARESAAFLASLVDGQQVRLSYGGRRRDVYGRALAHVRLKSDGRWVQGEMLRAGAARVRSYGDNRALVGDMLAIEAEARETGRGLWADGAYDVRSPDELTGDDGFQLVEGRARRTRDIGRSLALDFDDDFTVLIDEDDLPAFGRAGKAPAGLLGRMLRVRGVIKDEGYGPDMRLDHPEQIEVLD